MNTMQGIITGLKNQKTASVKIFSQSVHPKYKKFIQRTKNLQVHYENIAVKEGDTVMITETRPLSKTKHFKILKVV